MFYPDVQFRLNKRLDKKTAISFLGFNIGGTNFANGILGVHPGIRRAIFDYIDKFYQKQESNLFRTAINFKKRWNLKAGLFFKAVDTIFQNYPWPGGKYIGYVSIFDCNPRFIENKTFQVFFRHKLGPVYLTAHELLHFIFYDYLEKRRTGLKSKLNEDELWRLSEIINEILFTLPSFKKLFGNRLKRSGYPEFKKVTSRIGKHELNKTIDINGLIDLGLEVLL